MKRGRLNLIFCIIPSNCHGCVFDDEKALQYFVENKWENVFINPVPYNPLR